MHQSQLLKNQPIKAEHCALYKGFATFLQKGKILARNLNGIKLIPLESFSMFSDVL